MFWRMTGFSTVSPVDTIMDKGNFTLEELLDEDEIIQECKALNGRLINFLRERTQVEQLVRYIVEEAPEDAVKGRTFKFPFIACEIFTCEVDIILQALVEDEELMNLLFSFLEPEHSHTTLLAGYFSQVVVCLLLRKSSPLMSYIHAHPDIIGKLVDLIGITSIMEVLIRLIADEYLYTSYSDLMEWLQDIDVLEMIVDKFSSSDCPEVHANAAESLCAITRNAPPGLAAKISSPSFIARLFHHALQDSRPKSVLVYCLSVCISLIDPKRLTSGTYNIYNQQFTHELEVKANPEIVEGMLESLGILLKLLDVSTEENLSTTYGKLQPPLGKHRLKVVEFISVLISAKSEAAEKELIRLGLLRRTLELFFQYPYNNFLHNHVEQIVVSCLESKNGSIVKHILEDCNLVRNIIDAERNSALSADKHITMPTVPTEGRVPPRIGNVGHMTRIANKLVQLEPHNSYIYTHLKYNSEWAEWHTNVLVNRNALANVYDWACGRPDAFHERGRDSDVDDYQDRDYGVAALANNLSQAFRYGIYENDANNEDDYFDNESAEVVISSLRLGDDRERGSLFANSNWFEFEEEDAVDEVSAIPSSTDTERISDASTSSNPHSSDTTNVNNLANDSRLNVPLEQTDSSESFDPNTDSSGPGPSCSTTNDPPSREVESNPKTQRDNKPSEISTSPPHGIDAELDTEPQQESETLAADGSTDHEEEI